MVARLDFLVALKDDASSIKATMDEKEALLEKQTCVGKKNN